LQRALQTGTKQRLFPAASSRLESELMVKLMFANLGSKEDVNAGQDVSGPSTRRAGTKFWR
jgi:hypothetical protein